MSQPTLVTPIYHETGSSWPSPLFSYEHFLTTSDSYVYQLNQTPGHSPYHIAYRWTDRTWYDYIDDGVVSNFKQHYFGNSATDFSSTARVSGVNPTTIYLLEIGNVVSCNAIINNVYYVTPPVTPPNTNSVFPSVSYVVADNELRIIIPSASVSTEIAGSANGNRQTYYQLRKISGTNFFEKIVHTQGWPTNHTIVPPSPGIYLLEKVRDNPLDYHSYNSVEVTQAQLDSWHSANNGHIYYDPSENYLHYFIHSSEDTTNLLFGSGGRELFYRVRSVNQSVHNFNHLHDYDTNGTYRPTAYGIYHLERVLTNPLEVLSYSSAEVSQSQLNAWNLLNAPPGADSGNNAPPNTPRGRRGNHNFW